MTHRNPLTHLATVVLLLTSTVLFAQKDKDKDAEEEKDEFAELIEDAVHREGFFDSYERNDHLYFVIPEGPLGRGLSVDLRDRSWYRFEPLARRADVGHLLWHADRGV